MALYPAPRIAYHRDGTRGFLKRSSSLGGEVVEMPQNALAALNDENRVSGWITAADWQSTVPAAETPAAAETIGEYFTLFFPEPVRLRGVYFASSGGGAIPTEARPTATEYSRLETSKNTTNTEDGDWDLLSIIPRSTDRTVSDGNPGGGITVNPFDFFRVVRLTTGEVLGSQGSEGSFIRPNVVNTYHERFGQVGEGIHDVSGPATDAVRAIRIYRHGVRTPSNSVAFVNLHLYGYVDEPSARRVEFVNTESERPVSPRDLDWGQRALDSTALRSYRLRNRSTTQTAEDIQISMEELQFRGDLIAESSTVVSQFSFSGDGSSWSSTLDLPDLAPGESSDIFFVRNVVPPIPLPFYSVPQPPQGRQEALMVASVGAWS